jgi:antitoxin component of MazEF toxin-antitoxin module
MQLKEIGVEIGDEVLVYVKGKKIIIEKVEV